MVGWHHRLDGHEFEQIWGVCNGQGSLVCCSPWDRKESDTTEWLSWLTDWLQYKDPYVRNPINSFTAVSLAFQAMPSSWCKPLTNIYWMNKWMKLKRIEVKYQRLKIKWPCLCVFWNPEVLTCILFHPGILFNMNYGNRFLRASCFLVPSKTWC